jgi:GlpG protein
MRIVGTCGSREHAARFVDYLLTLGIGSEPRGEGAAWDVWVYDEDSVTRAAQELREFLGAPDAPKYAVSAEAEKLRRTQPAVAARPEPPTRERAEGWVRAPAWHLMPISIGLIAVSVAVAVLSGLGRDSRVLLWLFCTPAAFSGGELWRLVTPIFIHFGFFHIFFNMLWLRQLGGLIEHVKGPWFYALLLLTIAVPSNVLQFVASGPGFGGMSGVVYGLFGYVWIKSRRDPFSGFFIEPTTVWLMLAWFVLGTTGRIGPIANWVHGTGLLVGMAFGWVPGRRRPRA